MTDGSINKLLANVKYFAANDVKTLPVGPHTEPEVVFNGMIIVGEFLRKSII